MAVLYLYIIYFNYNRRALHSTRSYRLEGFSCFVFHFSHLYCCSMCLFVFFVNFCITFHYTFCCLTLFHYHFHLHCSCWALSSSIYLSTTGFQLSYTTFQSSETNWKRFSAQRQHMILICKPFIRCSSTRITNHFAIDSNFTLKHHPTKCHLITF